MRGSDRLHVLNVKLLLPESVKLNEKLQFVGAYLVKSTSLDSIFIPAPARMLYIQDLYLVSSSERVQSKYLILYQFECSIYRTSTW